MPDGKKYLLLKGKFMKAQIKKEDLLMS